MYTSYYMDTVPFSVRCVETRKLTEGFPGLVPVVIEKAPRIKMKSVWIRNVYPKSTPLREIYVYLRWHLRVREDTHFAIYICGALPGLNCDMGALHNNFSHADGYLYLAYGDGTTEAGKMKLVEPRSSRGVQAEEYALQGRLELPFLQGKPEALAHAQLSSEATSGNRSESSSGEKLSDLFPCHQSNRSRPLNSEKGACALPVEGACALPVEGACALPVEGACALPVEGACALPVEGACALPLEGACALPVEGACALPVEGACALPVEGACALPVEGACALPVEGACALPVEGACALFDCGDEEIMWEQDFDECWEKYNRTRFNDFPGPASGEKGADSFPDGETQSACSQESFDSSSFGYYYLSSDSSHSSSGSGDSSSGSGDLPRSLYAANVSTSDYRVSPAPTTGRSRSPIPFSHSRSAPSLSCEGSSSHFFSTRRSRSSPVSVCMDITTVTSAIRELLTLPQDQAGTLRRSRSAETFRPVESLQPRQARSAPSSRQESPEPLANDYISHYFP